MPAGTASLRARIPCSNFFFAAADFAALTRGSCDATVFRATCAGCLVPRLPAERLRAVLLVDLRGDFRVDVLAVLGVMTILAWIRSTDSSPMITGLRVDTCRKFHRRFPSRSSRNRSTGDGRTNPGGAPSKGCAIRRSRSKRVGASVSSHPWSWSERVSWAERVSRSAGPEASGQSSRRSSSRTRFRRGCA